MNPLSLAMKYMDIFYNDGNINELKNIFTDNCKFIGPFHEFTTADDYINSLLKNPPRNLKYKIIKTFEDTHSACIIYEFSKQGISIPMAQLFDTKDGRISKILLIFDSKLFH